MIEPVSLTALLLIAGGSALISSGTTIGAGMLQATDTEKSRKEALRLAEINRQDELQTNRMKNELAANKLDLTDKEIKQQNKQLREYKFLKDKEIKSTLAQQDYKSKQELGSSLGLTNESFLFRDRMLGKV